MQGGQQMTSTMQPAGMQPGPYNDLERQAGGGKQPVSSLDAAIRAGFIQKVYGILSFQMLVTVGAAAFIMLHDSTRKFVLATPAMFYAALFLPLGFICALMAYKNKHPHNLYILGGFTLCEAYTIGVVCAMYYEGGMGMIVLQAFMLTAAIFCSLTAYTFVTKKDFSFLGAGLFGGLIVLIVWGMLNAIFDFGGGNMIFSLFGSLLFAGYILYDTSMIMLHLGPDDYIEGAINLYLDIVNLFLYLLELLRTIQGGD